MRKQNFCRKFERKGSLGRRGRRWKDNIKVYSTEVGYEVVDWIHVAQDSDYWRALVYGIMNLEVP